MAWTGLHPGEAAPMTRWRPQGGYILLPVVLAITLVAAIAFMMNEESAGEADRGGGELAADQALYAAQAGLQHALWRSDHNACAGDLSLPVTGLGPGSYSATVDSAVSSTSQYHLAPDRDSDLKEDTPDQAYGSDAELQVKTQAGGDRRAVYHFDLSGISAGARVVSATLRLYVTLNDAQGAVDIHPVTTPWTEADATWNTLADQYDGAILGRVPQQLAAGVWVAVNLTALTQSWVNDAAANHGIMLIAGSDGVSSSYTSLDYGSSAQRPYLEVTTAVGAVSPVQITAQGAAAGAQQGITRTAVAAYQPALTLTLQPDAVQGKDTYIYDWKSAWNYGAARALWVTGNTPGNFSRSLLRFELGDIPPGARILSASLALHQNTPGSNGGTVGIYRITSDWVEGTASGGNGAGANWNERDTGVAWTVPGGDYGSTVFATTTIPAGTVDWFAWDVTQLVDGWVTGRYGNYGLLLLPESTSTLVYFDSSDDADPGVHPKLTITYACECGNPCIVPRGAGNVLLVVGDDLNLTTGDVYKKALFESWGYALTLIDDQANQATFDTAMTTQDLAYVSESADPNRVWDKLTATPRGVVNEEGGSNSLLGISSGAAWTTGRAVDVVDNSHYITALFPAGPLDIYSANMDGLTAAPALATDLQTLANWGSDPALAVVEQGGVLADGTSAAAGRRVMLPLGRDTLLDWRFLNDAGRLLVQRALQWAAGLPAACADGNFRDEFASVAFGNSDGSLAWSGDWSELDDGGAGPAAGKAQIIGGELRLNGPVTVIMPFPSGDPVYYPSLSRALDLSAYASATLSFDYRTDSGVNAGVDSAVVEISADGGTTWAVLADFVDAGPNAAGSRSFDISAYIGPDTRVRVRLNAGYSGGNDYFYLDNVDVAASCSPAPPGPIAHWRLDDGAGTTALDSQGGHDGTLSGGAWAPGIIDGALDFDGVADHVLVADDPSLDITGPITLSAWVRPNKVGTQYVVRKAQYGSTDGYELSLSTSGMVFFRLNQATQGNTFRIDSTTAYPSDGATWMHLAATYDGAVERLYINGVEEASQAAAITIGTNATDLSLGGQADGSRVIDGLVDDVRLYDRALSGTEIATLAASGGGPGPGGCSGTFQDNFDARAFTGSNGSLPWAGAWLEINEGDGATKGDEQVISADNSYQLQVRDNDGGGEGVERQADLSAYTTAILSFDYRRVGLDNSADYITADISADGGGSWRELGRFQGPANDGAALSASYDISADIAANTRVRFLTSPTLGNTDALRVDNVQIEVSGCAP